jgi:hypothetical protein
MLRRNFLLNLLSAVTAFLLGTRKVAANPLPEVTDQHGRIVTLEGHVFFVKREPGPALDFGQPVDLGFCEGTSLPQ